MILSGIELGCNYFYILDCSPLINVAHLLLIIDLRIHPHGKL